MSLLNGGYLMKNSENFERTRIKKWVSINQTILELVAYCCILVTWRLDLEDDIGRTGFCLS